MTARGSRRARRPEPPDLFRAAPFSRRSEGIPRYRSVCPIAACAVAAMHSASRSIRVPTPSRTARASALPPPAFCSSSMRMCDRPISAASRSVGAHGRLSRDGQQDLQSGNRSRPPIGSPCARRHPRTLRLSHARPVSSRHAEERTIEATGTATTSSGVILWNWRDRRLPRQSGVGAENEVLFHPGNERLQGLFLLDASFDFAFPEIRSTIDEMRDQKKKALAIACLI